MESIIENRNCFKEANSTLLFCKKQIIALTEENIRITESNRRNCCNVYKAPVTKDVDKEVHTIYEEITEVYMKEVEMAPKKIKKRKDGIVWNIKMP